MFLSFCGGWRKGKGDRVSMLILWEAIPYTWYLVCSAFGFWSRTCNLATIFGVDFLYL